MAQAVTEVQFYPVKPKNGLIGFASMLIFNSIYLSSIGVYTRKNGKGYRITYPTKKIGKKNFNIFHPINKDMAALLEAAVIAKVDEVMS
jgi:stage V sporulation protein G